jgi:hypothetical protein
MIAPGVIKNVYEMKIRQFDNGDWEWKYDQSARPDARMMNEAVREPTNKL